MTRKVPWSISYQLAAVRPERYPLSQPRSELVHTGDDPVLCGAYHQREMDRGTLGSGSIPDAPLVSVFFSPRHFQIRIRHLAYG